MLSGAQSLSARQAVHREYLRCLVGAVLGVLVTALVCRSLTSAASPVPWIVAPMGASAVLMFLTPGSPLAQPWPVIGGNTVSTFVGAACFLFIPDGAIAAAAALGLAMGVMFLLRCVHPPGGAAAMLAALTGPDWSFALFPILSNSVLLIVVAVVYNRSTGRQYPCAFKAPFPVSVGSVSAGLGMEGQPQGMHEVAARSSDSFSNIGRAGCDQLKLHESPAKNLRTTDIMVRTVVAVQYDTSVQESWRLMRASHVKALPVVDHARRIVGIVTISDFLKYAGAQRNLRVPARLGRLLRPGSQARAHRHEVAGQIMTRAVVCTQAEASLAEVARLFNEHGHRHIPVIDAELRLVGMATQANMLEALVRLH